MCKYLEKKRGELWYIETKRILLHTTLSRKRINVLLSEGIVHYLQGRISLNWLLHTLILLRASQTELIRSPLVQVIKELASLSDEQAQLGPQLCRLNNLLLKVLQVIELEEE
jgi:hypothetical protein